MPDITTKSKWLFWTMILTVFIFTTVPSVVLIDSFKSYHRFLTGYNPGTLKTSPARRTPHRELERIDGNLDIHFVEFRLAAAAAKEVRLAAGFNRWKSESLPLEKDANGLWSVVVPLPAGSYRYAFEVDGTWTLDPGEPGKSRWAGKEVSVRKVK